MLRLIRFFFSLFCFFALLWFATNVKLGKKTLWQHMQAIFATREAHDLAEGTKQEARKVADKLRIDEAADLGAALDPLSEKDRHELDKLIKKTVK